MSNITINIGKETEPKPRKRARVAVPQDPNRRPIKVVRPSQPQAAPAVMAMPQATAMPLMQQATQPQAVILRQPNQIARPQSVPVRRAAQPIARPQAVSQRPISRGTSNKKKVLNAAKYATPWGAARGGLKVANKLTNNKVMNVAKYATPWGAAKGGLKVAGKVGKKLGKKLKRFR